MFNIYLVFIIFLFILAFSDLMIGVSNDAVNFLNSAIGSKIASFRTILIVASLGIVIGATFSSGLMEIARKGLFFSGTVHLLRSSGYIFGCNDFRCYYAGFI